MDAADTSRKPLNLNAVEASEIRDTLKHTGPTGAGPSNPYTGASYAAGTETAGAERGVGMGYGPSTAPAAEDPAQQQEDGDGLRDAGMGALGPLAAVKEGVSGALGTKGG